MAATTSVTRVAVIGAGVSGLTAIKSCLEEGLLPVCFELFDTIGGCWKYTDHVLPGQGAAVFESLTANTSKEMTCFSDFPPPQNFPVYSTHWEFMNYIESYAKHFGLMKYIRFQHYVIEITPISDKDVTGKWQVKYQPMDSSSVESKSLKTEVFDRVVVCTGFFKRPVYPSIEGLSSFQNETMHSHSFRTRDLFTGKTVLVIDAYGDSSLYRMTFPTSIKQGTLAIVGFGFVLGPVWPCIELQSRWVARVFSGRCQLPSYQRMTQEIQNRKASSTKVHGYPKPMIAPLEFRNEIARELGVQPSFWKLLLTDPVLAMHFFLGPAFTVHHRLVGPYAWAGARAAALAAYDNVRAATRTRQMNDNCIPSHRNSIWLLVLTGIVALVAVRVYW